MVDQNRKAEEFRALLGGDLIGNLPGIDSARADDAHRIDGGAARWQRCATD